MNNASDAQSANKYHTIKINHLSGNGHFHYLTDLAKNLGDKVLVKESASGHYQLHVQNKTGEPNQEGLDLFDASSVQDRSRLFVSLANHYVDLGALRYTIKTENGITRLYNPYAGNRRPVKPAPSPAANTASQAQKATQTDGAQIAKPQNIVVAPPSPQANQAEEALRQQAKAEQVKRQQAAEAEKVARQKDEEAKRKAAEIARQQEEARKAAELAAKQKAEAERKARELARQKAEEASHQANAKPKRRRRRAILPRPPAPVFSLDDYDAKDNSESSIGNLARVIPRMGRELINDYEEIPLEELEDEAEEERRQATQFQPKSRNRRAISSEPSSKAALWGKIQGQGNSRVSLNQHSKWQMKMHLNRFPHQTNTLKIIRNFMKKLRQ
ncbi:pertactin-like passenger domain-containing protein [Neisseria gonorrhoeae]